MELKTIFSRISNTDKEKAEIFEGYEGLKIAYEEGLNLLKKDDEILVLGASTGQYTDQLKYKRFFERINLGD